MAQPEKIRDVFKPGGVKVIFFPVAFHKVCHEFTRKRFVFIRDDRIPQHVVQQNTDIIHKPIVAGIIKIKCSDFIVVPIEIAVVQIGVHK